MQKVGRRRRRERTEIHPELFPKVLPWEIMTTPLRQPFHTNCPPKVIVLQMGNTMRTRTSIPRRTPSQKLVSLPLNKNVLDPGLEYPPKNPPGNRYTLTPFRAPFRESTFTSELYSDN